MLLFQGTVVGLLGAMGGHGQPQTLVQLVLGLLRGGLDPADAIAAPRWYDGSGLNGQTAWVEEGYDPQEIALAQASGYRIENTGRFDQRMGHAQVVLRDLETGVLIGGADPRGEGLALGL